MAAVRGRGCRACLSCRVFPRADAEAIVVGGGPAGSTIAAALAEAGHRVLLLDKARFPRHKACSEYINAGGVRNCSIRWACSMTSSRRRPPDGGDDRPRAERPPLHGEFRQSRAGSRRARALPLPASTTCCWNGRRRPGVIVCERAHVREVVREAWAGRWRRRHDRRQPRGAVAAPLVIGADGHNSVGRPRRWSLDAHGSLAAQDRTGGALPWRQRPRPVRRDARRPPALRRAGAARRRADQRRGGRRGARDVERRSGSIDEFFADAIQAMPSVATKLDGAERVGGIRGVGSMAQPGPPHLRRRLPAGRRCRLVPRSLHR